MNATYQEWTIWRADGRLISDWTTGATAQEALEAVDQPRVGGYRLTAGALYLVIPKGGVDGAAAFRWEIPDQPSPRAVRIT